VFLKSNSKTSSQECRQICTTFIPLYETTCSTQPPLLLRKIEFQVLANQRAKCSGILFVNAPYTTRALLERLVSSPTIYWSQLQWCIKRWFPFFLYFLWQSTNTHFPHKRKFVTQIDGRMINVFVINGFYIKHIKLLILGKRKFT